MGDDAIRSHRAPAREQSTAMCAGELLRSLVYALSVGDHTALLRWCVERAADGDPLPAAWEACTDSESMVDVLFAVNRGAWLALHDGGNAWAIHELKCRGVLCDASVCTDCLAEVRRVVPTLTLAEVLEARRG